MIVCLLPSAWHMATQDKRFFSRSGRFFIWVETRAATPTPQQSTIGATNAGRRVTPSRYSYNGTKHSGKVSFAFLWTTKDCNPSGKLSRVISIFQSLSC
jgi:hypothetical protein